MKLFKTLYLKLVKINDSPLKISLGFALGVALGIMPGTGVLAALILAVILRLNRMAALIGSLAVNTWLSVLTLFLAIKIGANIFSFHWQDLYSDWLILLNNFQWLTLFKTSVYKIILPIFTGYVIISICIGVVTYIISIIILTRCNRR